MPHLVVLASGFGWHVQDLQRASKRHGARFQPLPFPGLTSRVGQGPVRIEAGGVNLGSADGVLVRMMPPGTLEQVVFRMDALQRLEASGVPVLNPPRAIEAAVDKYLALAKLDGQGLSVPETWVGESADEALRAFESLGGDVVVKPIFGSEGRGLLRISDRELAVRAFKTLERLGAVLYLQRFLPNEGHDLRAFVIGDRVIGAIRRFPSPGDWRANLSRGGRAEPIAIDPETERLAIRSAQAIGAKVAGVDLLPTRSGDLVVLEVNAVPGWRGLASATGIDVAAEILGELLGASR